MLYASTAECLLREQEVALAPGTVTPAHCPLRCPAVCSRYKLPVGAVQLHVAAAAH
jgi:hypothetical protein